MNILIADSGSTKTHWVLINSIGNQKEFFCEGINPFFVDENQIVDIVNQCIPTQERVIVDSLHFYGAGCSNVQKCNIVQSALNQSFSNASIEVTNDLLASARALFGHSAGVACILGTGSNAAVYSGFDFVDQIKSVGYLLGDEGSGAYIGKQLLIDFLHRDLPTDLHQKFEIKYNFDINEVLDKVYKQKFPNRFLASFTPFATDNIDNEYIQNLISQSFGNFVRHQLNTLNFDKNANKVSFVGSVAFYFREILKSILESNGYSVGQILPSPMPGLVDFHLVK